MNIIKFKDAYGPDDKFNEIMRGKYAYWINMQYAVSFDSISVEEYIRFERHPEKLIKSGVCFWDTNRGAINILVDIEETENINSIKILRAKNEYVPRDITAEELKKFRTWLAKRLLDFNTFDEDTKMMISYYAGDMYDGTVKILSKIDRSLNITVAGTSGSCNTCSNISDPFAKTINTCDPLETYRIYMYTNMVKLFSDTDFWMHQYSGLMQEFLIYINGLIRTGLPISKTSKKKYIDCECVGKSANEDYIGTLRRLAQSIEYILDGNTQNHKLFMSKAFSDWATTYYELMQW